MPYPNKLGNYCAGAAGDGGVVSINGQIVLGPSAGTGGWLNDLEVMSQFYGDVPPRLVATKQDGSTRILSERGASWLDCAVDTWVAVLDAYRTTGDVPWTGPPVLRMGRDGSLATKVSPGGGLILAGRHLSDADVQQLTVINKDTALWVEPGYQVRSIGLPELVGMPATFYGLRPVLLRGVWWALYQDGYRLVLRPFYDSQTGYVFPVLNAFGPDVCAFGDGARVVWAESQGEQPADIRKADQSLDAPRVPLNTPVPVPVPIPVPVPTPVPEPTPMSLIAPNIEAEVTKQISLHPEVNTRDEVARGKILDYVCEAKGGKPWGRKARNADGSNKNTDGLTFLRTDGLFEIYDVIDGGSGSASWEGFGPFRPGENGWWAPHEPVEGPAPVPVPVPEPTPQPCDCKEELAALRRLIEQVFKQLDVVTVDVTAAKMDAENALKIAQQPRPVDLSGLKVEAHKDGTLVSTGSTWGHAHQIKLRIVKE